MSDGEFYEIAAECERLISKGSTIFQKFSCIACDARQTMDTSNTLYKEGRCQECGTVTDLVQSGCGFMLIASHDKEKHKEFVDALTEEIRAAEPHNRN